MERRLRRVKQRHPVTPYSSCPRHLRFIHLILLSTIFYWLVTRTKISPYVGTFASEPTKRCDVADDCPHLTGGTTSIVLRKRHKIRIVVDRFTWLAVMPVGDLQCRLSACTLQLSGTEYTKDTSPRLDTSVDAWVTSAPTLYSGPVPVRSSGYQHIFFVSLEPCALYPQYCSEAWLHKYGVTYALSMQHVPNFPRKNLSFITWDIESSFNKSLSITEKRRAIAVFIGNCDITNTNRTKRLKYLLSAGLDVHSYGQCLHSHDINTEFRECALLPRPNALDDRQKVCVFQHYRFALVIENFVSPGYMSEKIFHAFLAGTVPIYFGHRDNSRYFPSSDAAVFLSENVESNADVELIRRLMNDDALYSSRLNWKNSATERRPEFVDLHENSIGKYGCMMCDEISGSFPILQNSSRLIQSVPELELTVFITTAGVHDYDGRNMIVMVASLEDFNPLLGDGNVQYAISAITELEKKITFRLKSPEGDLQTCKLVPQFYNYLIVCTPFLIHESYTASLRIDITHNKSMAAYDLDIPLEPESEQPSQHEVGICAATVYGKIDHVTIRRLVEWMQHHITIGFELILLYAREIEPLSILLTQFSELELVEFPPLSRSVENIAKANGYYDQSYALNDCLYRMKRRVTYISFQDIDEFFMFDDPRQSLHVFLSDAFQGSTSSLSFETVHFIASREESQQFDGSSLQLTKYDTAVLTPGFNKMIVSAALTGSVLNHAAPGVEKPISNTTAYFRHFVNTFQPRYRPEQSLIVVKHPITHGYLRQLQAVVEEIVERISQSSRSTLSPLGK